jgi:hypothetical protein
VLGEVEYHKVEIQAHHTACNTLAILESQIQCTSNHPHTYLSGPLSLELSLSVDPNSERMMNGLLCNRKKEERRNSDQEPNLLRR